MVIDRLELQPASEGSMTSLSMRTTQAARRLS
jgi:hypothetical protein